MQATKLFGRMYWGNYHDSSCFICFSDELLTYKFRDDHPFNQKRLQITLDLLKKHGAIQDKDIIPPRIATKEELDLIHDSVM